MILKEEKRDLFEVPVEYHLAHCISADFGMAAGIAVEFNKRFNMKIKLMSKYGSTTYPNCLVENGVFNLVTKDKYWQKPSIETLQGALNCMRDYVLENNITKIAMPKIGCGLDRLQWGSVKEVINDTFKDIDIEILICYI